MTLRYARQYRTLPPAPTRGPLPPMVSVVIPLDRTNLISNPSFETNTTGWSVTGGGASIARSTAQQYHGVYSLAVTAAGIQAEAIYSVTLTSGVTYALSTKFLGTLGRNYQMSFATSGGVLLNTTTFVATGRWQWITLIYKAASTASHQLRFSFLTSGLNDTFYLDGVQLESLADGILAPTTYLDGDQVGLLSGQQPPAYGWNGTPHASTSYRTALTRAGGYLVNLSTYNFLLTGLIGLGMAAPNNISVPYTVLDGARYLRTQKPARTFSLVGRWQSDDVREQYLMASDMRAVLDRDLVPLQQPLVLQVEPMDECEQAIGDFAQIPCIYAGGLEGNDGNVPVEDVAPTFTMYVPYLVGGDAGAALAVQTTFTANRVARRTPSGTWQALSTGLGTLGGALQVNTIAELLDGRIFLGGDFTVAGGAPDNYGILYNPTTNTFSTMGGGGQFTGLINSSAVGPNGVLYLTGIFTNAAGIAAADNIVSYNPTTDTFAALGTGANGTVNAVAVGPTGIVYAGGPAATDFGGVANTNGFGVWDGSAWTAISTGIDLGSILAILTVGNRVYVGGSMTAMSGVANTQRVAYTTGSAWISQTTTPPDNTVTVIGRAPNGNLIYGGVFTGKLAIWNSAGFTYSTALNSSVNEVDVSPLSGIVWVGGDFTTINGIPAADSFAQLLGTQLTGTQLVGADVNLPGTASIKAIHFTRGGDLYVGFNTNGTATAAAITTVTNSAPGIVYPTLTINGPSSGTSRIYQLVNYTTGLGVYLNLTLSPGEVATLRFDPQNPSFTTTFQGDITGAIMPGSQPALLYLAPGANAMSFFAASSTVTAALSWQKRYNGMADLVN